MRNSFLAFPHPLSPPVNPKANPYSSSFCSPHQEGEKPTHPSFNYHWSLQRRTRESIPAFLPHLFMPKMSASTPRHRYTGVCTPWDLFPSQWLKQESATCLNQQLSKKQLLWQLRLEPPDLCFLPWCIPEVIIVRISEYYPTSE